MSQSGILQKILENFFGSSMQMIDFLSQFEFLVKKHFELDKVYDLNGFCLVKRKLSASGDEEILQFLDNKFDLIEEVTLRNRASEQLVLNEFLSFNEEEERDLQVAVSPLMRDFFERTLALNDPDSPVRKSSSLPKILLEEERNGNQYSERPDVPLFEESEDGYQKVHPVSRAFAADDEISFKPPFSEEPDLFSEIGLHPEKEEIVEKKEVVPLQEEPEPVFTHSSIVTAEPDDEDEEEFTVFEGGMKVAPVDAEPEKLSEPNGDDALDIFIESLVEQDENGELPVEEIEVPSEPEATEIEEIVATDSSEAEEIVENDPQVESNTVPDSPEITEELTEPDLNHEELPVEMKSEDLIIETLPEFTEVESEVEESGEKPEDTPEEPEEDTVTGEEDSPIKNEFISEENPEDITPFPVRKQRISIFDDIEDEPEAEETVLQDEHPESNLQTEKPADIPQEEELIPEVDELPEVIEEPEESEEQPSEPVKEEPVAEEIPGDQLESDVVEPVAEEIPEEQVESDVVEPVAEEISEGKIESDVVEPVAEEISEEQVESDVVELVAEEIPEETVEPVFQEIPEETTEPITEEPVEVSKPDSHNDEEEPEKLLFDESFFDDVIETPGTEGSVSEEEVPAVQDETPATEQPVFFEDSVFETEEKIEGEAEQKPHLDQSVVDQEYPPQEPVATITHQEELSGEVFHHLEPPVTKVESTDDSSKNLEYDSGARIESYDKSSENFEYDKFEIPNNQTEETVEMKSEKNTVESEPEENKGTFSVLIKMLIVLIVIIATYFILSASGFLKGKSAAITEDYLAKGAVVIGDSSSFADKREYPFNRDTQNDLNVTGVSVKSGQYYEVAENGTLNPIQYDTAKVKNYKVTVPPDSLLNKNEPKAKKGEKSKDKKEKETGKKTDPGNIALQDAVKNKVKEKKLADYVFKAGKKYYVQVSAHRSFDTAEKLAKDLSHKGYKAFIMKIKKDGVEGENGIWYRVRLGPFDKEDKAMEINTALNTKKKK